MTELIIAFGAGLISFLSPCVLPLIPGYIAFISGSTFNELLEKKINLTPIIYFTLRIFNNIYNFWNGGNIYRTIVVKKF